MSWVAVVVAITLHLLMNAKVGGTPLLLSMLHWQSRDSDRPTLWSHHITQWWAMLRRGTGANWIQSMSALWLMEWAILISIALSLDRSTV
jgi:hypothetical protein